MACWISPISPLGLRKEIQIMYISIQDTAGLRSDHIFASSLKNFILFSPVVLPDKLAKILAFDGQHRTGKLIITSVATKSFRIVNGLKTMDSQ